MTDDILLTIGEDGKASLYDDTYDITIHCESQEEQDEVKRVLQNVPHWIPVTEDTPDEERECWITPKTTSKVYRGVFTRHYGECHRTGFICDDGFMWLNTALAWMYCELPEPYKGVTT